MKSFEKSAGRNICIQAFVNSRVEKRIVSPDRVLAELEKKARECDERAEQAPDAEAAALREEAERCRNWTKSLRTGYWKA